MNGENRSLHDRRTHRGWPVAMALLGAALGILGARALPVRGDSTPTLDGLIPASPAATAPREPLPAPETRERVELRLDLARLPAADLERMNAQREHRATALRAATAGVAAPGGPYRVEPESVLAESLAMLAQAGALVDAPDAVVNLDTIELDLAPGARPFVAALPFVAAVQAPLVTQPAGRFDSAGVTGLGASISHTAGITGQGVTVAIIDEAFDNLNAMMALTNPVELGTVPVSRQWCEQGGGNGCGSGTGFLSTDLDAPVISTTDHGTAVAEALYEIAPGATLVLYRAVTASGIQKAIRDAWLNRGAKVIVVARQSMTLMEQAPACSSGVVTPTSPATCNPYVDEVQDASAGGALVVFPSGDYGASHVADQFFACGTTCDDIAAANSVPVDPEDRKWELFLSDALGLFLPILPLDLHQDVFLPFAEDEPGFQLKLTCSSAISDTTKSSKYELRLLRDVDGFTFGSDVVLPSEVTAAGGFERLAFAPLGGSFTQTLSVDFLNNDQFYIGIKALCDTTNSGSPADDCGLSPRFRIACDYPFYFSSSGDAIFSAAGSLSDMATIDQALVVGGYDADSFDLVAPFSSQGPIDPLDTDFGSIKPDVVADARINSYTTCLAEGGTPPVCGDVYGGIFAGTSASAAAAGGLAALFVQKRAVDVPAQPYTAPQLKGAIKANAQAHLDSDFDFNGWDDTFGAGLAQGPNVTPATQLFTLPPCRLVDTRCPGGACSAPSLPVSNQGPQLTAGQTRSFQAIGLCNIPPEAKAIAVNVTAVSPTAAGFLSVFPSNQPPPSTSNINFIAGTVRANNAIVSLSRDGEGKISAFNGSSGTTDLLVDVAGYFE